MNEYINEFISALQSVLFTAPTFDLDGTTVRKEALVTSLQLLIALAKC